MRIIHGMGWETFLTTSAVGLAICVVSLCLAFMLDKFNKKSESELFTKLAVMAGFSTAFFFFGSIILSIITFLVKAIFKLF